ncbi:MFS transporter [Bradyrhizobium tropiciagri]|uniref:MFS transporter n=1 Tax=Bradyrhizobium tropiciagri TaxID=312253 RepID=UPI001BA880FF|nr:MFS transporter [Bradyrhizobium tropiciagri]MBR0875542.1 MFS transporter [Bradyrhizobium tropiciagri]
MSEADAETIDLPADTAVPRRRIAAKATPRQVLAIVSVGICLANLDLFIVNVGLPNIAQEFRDASLEDLSWILNGYAIAYAALLVFFGRLAERHSRNLSFLLGVALFTAASAACALARNVEFLVIARIAQAAGAALMTPTSIGLLLASFPAEQRAGAVRTWTAIGGLAAALGPPVGGVLVTFDWRWIFIVNVPIGIAALVIGWLKLPEVPGHDVPRPNPWAALLVTCGIGALTFAIVKANDWGWGSRGIVVAFAVAAVCLAAFIRHCLTSKNPFVDPALFAVRPFTGASLVMAPYSAAFGAMLFSVALWEQTVWGWSALQTGLAIAPGPLLVPITSLLFAGRLIVRFGAAAVVSAGILCFAAGLVIWAALMGADANVPAVVAGVMLIGIGVGLTFPTLMGVGAGSLPPSSFATGSGVINMIRQAALAIGVAISVAILAAPVTMADRIVAFQRGWWIMVAITLAGFIPNYLFIRRKTGH